MRTTNRSSSTAEDMNGKMSPALIELHVYNMPSDLWREHLHSAISKIVDDTVSAGFIRVPPDLPLSKVRREIAQQIGTSNVVPQSYVFIKSVGRCFTRLTHRQERELLAKHFAPPIADVPEIFLLDSAAPGPNEQQSSDYDDQPSGRNRLMEMLRNRKKRTVSSGLPTTKSSTPQSAARVPRAPSTSSSDHSTATPVPPPSSLPLPRRRLPAEFDVGQPRHSSTEKLAHSQPQLAPTPVVAPAGHEPHVSRHPVTPQSVKWSPPLDEPVEDRSVASAHNRSRQDWHEPQHEEPHPVQSGNLLNELENEKKRLRKELKHLRTRRNEMERLRQELTKRVKQLNASNALSRKQAREDWKKRYYDEKKKSTPKEEQCTKLRHELEQWHRRISSQLEMARETGRRVGGQQVTDQAELKIKSTKCEQDIEELHTRLQNVKLRLTTEIKLRNQAEMEMQALKFDLAEKKSTAHRSRSQAYYAAAHNNAQDVQLSARIQANMGAASGSAPMHPSATVGTANHPASGIPVSQARNSQPSATFGRTSHTRW